MKAKLVIGAIGFLSLMQTVQASPVIGGVSVDERRDRATVTYRNATNKEVYCENVRVDYKVIGYEFNEPIGEFSENLGSTYLQPHEEVVFADRAQELNRFHTKNRKAVLGTADGDFSNCRVVNFNDYCNYAEKDKHELYTLQSIKSAAKTGRCEDVEPYLEKSKGRLKLKDLGVYNLKPLSFLTQIKELNLSNNYVDSVEMLKGLTQLVKLDVSKNGGLKEIDAVINLPNIESIDASSTSLAFKNWPSVSPRLKKYGLNVRDTPFEQVYKEQKKNRP